MQVKAVSWNPDAEKTILHCARVSNPNNQNSTNTNLINYCIKHGHWSIFEMAHMVVEIETSRGISAQILRHWSFSFQEFSQRYAAVDSSGVEIYAARRQDTKNRQNSIDDLAKEVQDEWEKRQLDNWKTSFEHYKWALDNGIAKECARFVLPLATKTKMYMSGDLRSWLHYIDLRSANGTQQEHKEIAEAIKKVFAEKFPIIAEAKGWV